MVKTDIEGKRKLKKKYLSIFIVILALIPVLAFILLSNKSLVTEEIDPSYSTETVTRETLPVINTTTRIIKPYIDSNVKVGKSYYDYQGKEEDQINAIIKHDNTYIQNTGIDYISDNTFEVMAILDGTVSNVKEDEAVGKTIEIKHNNGYISIYQSLSEMNVKKGDIISQGQIIGKSGTNELDKDLGNHLHFEIYDNGQSLNPENYYNKEVDLKKEN